MELTSLTVAPTRENPQTSQSLTALLSRFGCGWLILFGAHLIAVQIRLRIPWGLKLGEEYNAQPAFLFILIAVALALSYGISLVSEKTAASRWLNRRRSFYILLVAVGCNLGLISIFLPDLSQLQLIYFAVSAVAIGLGTIVYPNRIGAFTPTSGIGAGLRKLYKGRFLLVLWLRYNIRARYSQTALGILWIVLLPLATSAVLAFAFTEFLQIKSDVPFICFILAALVPWGLFNQGVFGGMKSILASMNLINQVNFAKEVLVLLVIGEALVDFAFTFVAMVAINLVNGIAPNIHFVFLVPILLILLSFVLGIGFFLSCASVFIRDIPQFVSVILQLLFYLTPIIYPLDRIPERFKVIALLNPLAPIIQSFRSIIIYNQNPDWISLYYPCVFAITVLIMGYSYFKANEERVADLV